MIKKKSSFLEIFWLFLGIVCLLIAIILHYKTDFSQSKLIYICAAISFFMFFLRRFIRFKNNPK